MEIMYLMQGPQCKIFFDNHNPIVFAFTTLQHTKLKISKLISSVVFDKVSSRRRINLQNPVSDYCT